ncbi:PREDICTED: transmembrane protein 136-like [Nicrophorus vespilloides]|uniref:Transmembrane protein 136-like n=1 Tax=Nicrophorus vespilloides TaxID=110193 RepID=A0ABM1MUD7_NICVS|nr:PREDICTED: transmembrane protein 136-like [Nicrophorus vespilloides]
MFANGHGIILMILPTICMWYGFYKALECVFKDKSAEYSNRIVTLVHACIVAYLGIGECFVDGWAFSTSNDYVTNSQMTVLLLSLGYFLFDLGWCLYYKTETNVMIAHHIYSCFAIYRTLQKDQYGNQAACSLGGMELTNPLLQVRWFLRTHGFQKTTVFTGVEWTFIAFFLVFRIILGTFVGYQIVSNPTHDWEYKGLAIMFYAVSWAFVFNMYNYVNKKYLRAELVAASSTLLNRNISGNS